MQNIVYDLNDENFMIYAIKHYDSPHCVLHEFEEDLKRVKYIKRLIGRYLSTGELKERLLLNHIIILSNVFGPDFTSRMLLLKGEPEHWPVIKTFLIYLNYLPQSLRISSIRGESINLNDIPFDEEALEILGKI
jgi:hypothetical protein